MNRRVFFFLILALLLMAYGLFATRPTREEDARPPLEIVDASERPSLEGLPRFQTPLPALPETEFGAIPREKIFTFSSDEDYQRFLTALAETDGIGALAKIDALRAVRVFDPEGLAARLLGGLGIEPSDAHGGAPNYVVTSPRVPQIDERAALDAVAFANNALEFLGIDAGDAANFGSGVKIAILDSGVVALESFRLAPENTILHPDAGDVTIESAGHGTAVASIIGSTDERVPGIAQGAELLSYAVFGENGFSDSFTLAEAIVAATDAGATVINASLGSFGDSAVVRSAVDYASERGAVIVAAGGNEQATELAYPARYESVIAVGAIDASGQQLTFSNAGPELDVVAPGQSVFTLGPEGTPVSFSGTSASAPFVSGTIAALLSIEPDLSAEQAAALVVEYADEAGAPGPDPNYGAGIPNLTRVLRRDQPNVRDPAVAGNHFVEDGDSWILQATVENRGTEPLSGPRLEIEFGGQKRVATGPTIPVNEIWVKEVPISGSRVRLAGEEGLSVTSNVSASRDVDAENNSATTTLIAPEK